MRQAEAGIGNNWMTARKGLEGLYHSSSVKGNKKVDNYFGRKALVALALAFTGIEIFSCLKVRRRQPS